MLRAHGSGYHGDAGGIDGHGGVEVISRISVNQTKDRGFLLRLSAGHRRSDGLGTESAISKIVVTGVRRRLVSEGLMTKETQSSPPQYRKRLRMRLRQQSHRAAFRLRLDDCLVASMIPSSKPAILAFPSRSPGSGFRMSPGAPLFHPESNGEFACFLPVPRGKEADARSDDGTTRADKGGNCRGLHAVRITQRA